MVAKTVKKSNAQSVRASGEKKPTKSAKDAAGSKDQVASQRKSGGPGKGN